MADTKYITYDEYTALGGSVSAELFNSLELKARIKLDNFTLDRIKLGKLEVTERVKVVMAEYINILAKTSESENQAGGRVNSFSNGRVSITYDNSKSEQQELNEKLAQIAFEALPVSYISEVVSDED